MTWRNFLLYGPYVGIALVFTLDRLHLRRTRRQYLERWGVPYDGP